jgi:hypothetical protein
MRRANAWTIERMFFGALVKAYSMDVMEARISEMAISNSSPNHGEGSGDETESNLFDRGEVNTNFSQSGIDEDIADWNEDDERKGIELSHNLRRYTLMLHCVRLRGQVVVYLVVADPVKWVPEEDGASHETSANFINPGIIEGHPLGTGSSRYVAWLDIFPELSVVHVLVSTDGVDGPFALCCSE